MDIGYSDGVRRFAVDRCLAHGDEWGGSRDAGWLGRAGVCAAAAAVLTTFSHAERHTADDQRDHPPRHPSGLLRDWRWSWSSRRCSRRPASPPPGQAARSVRRLESGVGRHRDRGVEMARRVRGTSGSDVHDPRTGFTGPFAQGNRSPEARARVSGVSARGLQRQHRRLRFVQVPRIAGPAHS